MKFRFNWRYAVLTLILFIIEVLIALFLHDRFIRPYVGDFLVVILVYCFVCSFMRARTLAIVLGVLLFACTVETLQYFNVVKLLGLSHSRVANIVIGTSFSWSDILAYVLGLLFTVVFEWIWGGNDYPSFEVRW
ncbi:DUF2809 domain-containing protein [Chitinophaga agrisoli]|uniref:DUF2809 domain-containing protein n=2 Tax=Chitinophaga agrisoli TaxID=2607653 RepID=A0A5B2VXZ1_9BACT|nr:DUF2809 domain-containing protein [Chitinophaga agrisoli]